MDRTNGHLKVLDLFCGLGGLSLGFELTRGFEVVGGIDNFEWAVKTFYANHNIKPKLLLNPLDLTMVTPVQVMDAIQTQPDVIVGGPPCQGFSHAGKRLKDIAADPRNNQVFIFLEFIKAIRPKAFLMENVSGILLTAQDKRLDLLNHLKKRYADLGYTVSFQLLNAADFRVPQNRKRVFLVGIADAEKPFRFPEPPCGYESNLFFEKEEYYTVSDALSDLPTPLDQDPQPYERPGDTHLQRFLRHGSEKLFNHIPTKHSREMTEKLVRQKVGTRLYPNWNHSWYRLHPEKPSPTVKENHRAPFVHFREHRATSPRECARLQTIPDRYVLRGTKSAQLVLLGNAVPAILSAHIATALAEQAFNHKLPTSWSASANPLKEY